MKKREEKMDRKGSSKGFALLALLTGLVMVIVFSFAGATSAQPKLKVGI